MELALGKLRTVKIVHTVVWAFFVACIVAVPVFAQAGMFRQAAVAAGTVLFEVAARYTEDRRDNFDIYLPEWLARHNKTIFSLLYVAGVIYAIIRWTTAQ